jgi:hypothetical protein
MLAYLSDLQFSPLGAEIIMSLACLAVVIFVVVVLLKRGVELTCPGCTKRVGRGELECPRCGFDFRASGANPS